MSNELVGPANDGLRIDDVIVHTAGNHIELDVRIRSTSAETVNITRADVEIVERNAYASIPVTSAEYDLIIAGEHNEVAVAHFLLKGEVDRFSLKLGFAPYNQSCGFRAKLHLRYNGNKVASYEDIVFESLFESPRWRF